MLEERLGADASISATVYGPGQSFGFAPEVIHRVRHGGGRPAVTLHVYSPPLDRLGPT